jgi:hypothetical protein
LVRGHVSELYFIKDGLWPRAQNIFFSFFFIHHSRGERRRLLHYIVCIGPWICISIKTARGRFMRRIVNFAFGQVKLLVHY